MKMLVDIGNSRCKSACYDGNEVRFHACIKTDSALSQFDKLFPEAESTIESVWVVSVVDQATELHFSDKVQVTFNCPTHFVSVDDSNTTLKTRYDKQLLGVDRFTSLLAAWHHHQRSCIVIGCGTALTIDYVDGQGVHQGGVIAPSLASAYQGLSAATVNLEIPEEQSSGDGLAWATHTESALTKGCHDMLVGTVKQTVAAMRAQGDNDAPLLVTGGVGEWLCTQIEAQLDRDLAFKGMALFSDMVSSS